jgi:hypothetical protein
MPDTLAALMTEYENPSAGKFGPPPGPSTQDGLARRRLWKVVPGALWIVAILLRDVLRIRGGRYGLITGMFFLATGIAQFVMIRKRRDERNGADPYLPPTNITR